MNHRILPRFAVLVSLAVLAVAMLLPFALVLLNAFKTPAEYSANGPLAFPEGLSLEGLVDFWERVDFGGKLLNSILISTAVAVLAVIVSVCNAYALGIGRIRGRTWILAFFLIANTLPQEAMIYPWYTMAKEAGLYDSRLSVIIICTVLQCAFGTYLMSSVLGQFPREVIEAAHLDGAGRLRTLTHVILPMSRSTLTVMFVFFFIWTWNEFLIPLILLISNDNQTVPVALGKLQGERMMDATMSSASALLGILPALVFFVLFQRTLTRGVTVGAIK
ncbi:carbohydrate ABC transporter permease [Thermomonospora umbrina]|uniref:Raffinose/stachyose/melibiose transport system permease protein n=1 Tax=Thermomonospora umbrina TaxID=111806 RepID=A0A3D9SH30_9ACTN|nr:carbohydrate ABC transporter permease [Thermomonospora umbrina]REE95206.1 raffinose/stachyose/melibiose transport system permease protein [Thermomonospora umbrina]